MKSRTCSFLSRVAAISVTRGSERGPRIVRMSTISTSGSAAGPMREVMARSRSRPLLARSWVSMLGVADPRMTQALLFVARTIPRSRALYGTPSSCL